MVDLIAGLVKQGQNLNEEEQKIMDFKNKLVDQFLAADKIVITTPMWNFSVLLYSKLTSIILLCPAGPSLMSKAGQLRAL